MPAFIVAYTFKHLLFKTKRATAIVDKLAPSNRWDQVYYKRTQAVAPLSFLLPENTMIVSAASYKCQASSTIQGIMLIYPP